MNIMTYTVDMLSLSLFESSLGRFETISLTFCENFEHMLIKYYQGWKQVSTASYGQSSISFIIMNKSLHNFHHPGIGIMCGRGIIRGPGSFAGGNICGPPCLFCFSMPFKNPASYSCDSRNRLLNFSYGLFFCFLCED